MKKRINQKRLGFIMSSLFALLFVAIIAFTIVGVTYADKAHIPDHVLNYETNRLYWSHGVSDIDDGGYYSLNLFESLPTGEDGMKIIAPGANSGGSMRLLNKTGHKIEYSATIFLINDAGVPITADFTNFDLTNIDTDYSLPDDVYSAKVLRAVKGELAGYGACDFVIEWEWAFSTGEDGDAFDTELGNLDLSEITLGVWITVSDPIEPTIPSDSNVNIDTNEDGIPDINLDTDGDGEAEINVDIDKDFIPDINVDKDGDKIPDINIDIDGDCLADFNFDDNSDGVSDTNILEFVIIDGIIIFDEKASNMVLNELSSEKPKIKLDNFGYPLIGIKLDTDSFAIYAENGNNLNIDYGKFFVTIDNQSLMDITGIARGDSVVILAEKMVKSSFNILQQDAFGENSLGFGIEFSVKSDNKLLNEYVTGNMNISASHELHGGTLIEDYLFYSVSYSGELKEEDFEYENGKLVFDISEDARFALLYTKGELDDGEVEPEPPGCTCTFLCLFGGNCSMCWLCWVLIALALILVLLVIANVVLTFACGFSWVITVSVGAAAMLLILLLLLLTL